MISRRGFLGFAGALLAGTTRAASVQGSANADTFEEWLRSAQFSAFIRMQMRAAHIPGLSVAVINQCDLVHTAGFGLADIAGGRGMMPDTLLNVGSVTKTITCTAVMQSCEQGKLHLDAPIDEYLPLKVRNPAFPERPITPRQLLTHTSSIADGPAYELSYARGDPRVTLLEWLQQYFTVGGRYFDASKNFKGWAPGGPYAYSNVGYGVLGLLVERLHEVSFADYCKEHIFAPLNMTNSRFLLTGMPREQHATPYAYVDSRDAAKLEVIEPAWTAPVGHNKMHVPHCLYSFPTMPDGLARTTAAELARFLMAYIRGGVLGDIRILSADTIRTVLSDQHVQRTKPSKETQGLAWYREQDIWEHHGGDPGVSAYVGFQPTDVRGIVVLANVNDASTEIAARILDRVGINTHSAP
jgi:CubicO group peptidase (beta-lactamase class C family)